MEPPTDTKAWLRTLPDKQLEDLRSAVNAEYRRRKRIHHKNAEWTANQGLEACLEASLGPRSGKEEPK